ncbi:MAG: rhodanese-like domain-containing protein, partial [Acidimicrobiia bacterium]
RAATELARIGFTNVLGVVRGVAAWLATGHPVSSFTTASHSDLANALTTADHDIQILDVRDPQEWERAHISGAIHRYVPDIRSGLPDGLDPTHPVWVVCQSGNRASIAAGLLERLDVEPIVVTRGGVSQVLASTGA